MTRQQQQLWYGLRYFLKQFTPSQMRWSARLAAVRTAGGWERTGWQEWRAKTWFVWLRAWGKV